MATFASIFPPAGDAVVLTPASHTSSAVQTLGDKHFLFAINADQDITIKFGTSAVADASATDWRIPSGVVATFDTGQFTSFKVYNLSGTTTANVYILPLSRS